MMKSLIELLASDNSQSLVSAIFMTYGFDADLFEQHILPAMFKVDTDIYENERRFRAQITENLLKIPVSVLVNGAGYQGGKTFLYDLYNIRGCTFHPKCFLLLYDNFLRIIIGSSNLTKAGTCYNAEIFWHLDLKSEDVALEAAGLKSLLDKIGVFAGLEDNPAYSNIQEFLRPFSDQEQRGKDIIHSTLESKSFSDKLLDLAEQQGSLIKSVGILSPFFESDMKDSIESAMMGELFNNLQKFFLPQAKVEICFPGWRSNEHSAWSVRAPINLLNDLKKSIPNLSFQIVSDMWKDEDGEEHSRPLHAKIIEMNFEDGKWLYLVGSPNFTRMAMTSKEDQLRNMEIGVFAYENSRIGFPKMDKVTLDQLLIINQDTPKIDDPIIFIEKAVYHAEEQSSYLMISVDCKKAIYPFEVVYQEKTIYHSNQPQAEIRIAPFKLGHAMDLIISYNDLSFTVPIQINEKYLAAQDDLVGMNFEPTIIDILAYQAGRFRSIEEILESKKRAGKTPGRELEFLIEGFRSNLNLLFKALDGIKRSLEQNAWSRDGFNYELNAPLGIKKLMNLIQTEYSKGNLMAPEAFFYMIEFSALLAHLEFDPGDRLQEDAKKELLSGLSDESNQLLKTLYSQATGDLKRQYQQMLQEYGLGGMA